MSIEHTSVHNRDQTRTFGVLEEDQCGQVLKALRPRQAAWQNEEEKAMSKGNMIAGVSTPCAIQRDEVDSSGLEHGDVFDIMTYR